MNCYNFSLSHKAKKFNKDSNPQRLLQHYTTKRNNKTFIKPNGNISHVRAQRMLSTLSDINKVYKSKFGGNISSVRVGNIRMP